MVTPTWGTHETKLKWRTAAEPCGGMMYPRASGAKAWGPLPH